MAETELQYRPAGNLDVSKVEAALDAVWKELRGDPDALRDATALGVDLSRLTSTPRDEAIAVHGRASGFGPESIIIVFLPLAVKIAGDVWSRIILPRLERKLGRGALTEETRGS
jgi:hypothetical protein